MKTIAAMIHLLLILLLGPPAHAQQTLAIPDGGWRLWLDHHASWQSDSIYLPEEALASNLPVNPPTGGWEALNPSNGLQVVLPSTVEEHYWGVNGLRKYTEEYFYEADDSLVQNGNYEGVSWWWRDIDIPKSFTGKTVTLFIRGARLRAEVYWERELVGYNIINEVSFTSDITKAVRPGKKNRLAIRITNPGGRLDWADTWMMTWGTTSQRFHKSHGFGGLDRGLELVAHDPVYCSDLWVLNTPTIRSVIPYVTIRNTSALRSEGTVRFEVLDPDRPNTVCAADEKKIELEAPGDYNVQTLLAYKDAQLWTNATPKLYRLRATFRAENEKARAGATHWKDARAVTFGFRWFSAEGVGTNATLRFNGERVRLISAISWGFWGRNGLWPTKELARRELKAAKTFGMNCIQFHRNVGKAEMLETQDRLGLMRYMEPGGGQTSFGEKFSLYAPSPHGTIDPSGKGGEPGTFGEKYMEEKIIRMIRDHRSHPSLLLWCIQNEIHPDLRNPRIFHVLRRMRQEDPSRLIVLKSGFPSGTPSVNQAWMAPYSEAVNYDTGNGYSGWWDDHTVGGPGVWRDEMYRGPEDFTHRSVNDREISMWGEMLGAAVPDNHEAMVRELEKTGGASYDLADHRRILDGYNRFLDRWGFRTAFPSAGALFTSIGNKSYDFWGRVIETARLAEANDYLVMSGWESTLIEDHSGLVDNLRHFKGDPSLIGRRLAPLRPVIRTRSLVFSHGDSTDIDLYVLNETHHPHARSLRVWCTLPGKQRENIGTFTVPPLEPDRFVYPVRMHVPLPKFPKEGEVRISAEIAGALVSEEKLLIVDQAAGRPLPRRIAVASSYPELLRTFQFLPGVSVEPYRPEGEYDVVIAAERLIRPPEASADTGRVIKGTDDQELYRSVHYGSPENFDFVFQGLPRGAAKVTLKFVELFQNAPGVRVFDVAINGDTVLRDFDVYRAAGGMNTAFDRSFSIKAPEGIVRITIPRVSAGSARIAAIKIESADTVIAVRCGGKPYTDRQGLLWRVYSPEVRLDRGLLDRVKHGLPLVVLAEGSVATSQFGERLGKEGAFAYRGHVGEVRASWMGNWYFVRKHPLYEGLPVNCGMGSYYQVPVTNADGILLEGKDVEVVAGYSRDHDTNVGAASFAARLGTGRIVFHTIPGLVTGLNGESSGMHPLFVKRLIANSLRYAVGETKSAVH